MSVKEHDVLLKKKTPSGVRNAPAAEGHAPVPEAGARMQQGATADMQQNVGNSGLKDLLADHGQHAGGHKDPSRMTPDELRAQAKKDAEALVKGKGGHGKSGPEKGAAKPGAKAGGHELDEKHKVALEAEAGRKKKEADSEKHSARAEEAKHAKEKASKKHAKPEVPGHEAGAHGAHAAHAKPAAEHGKAAAEHGGAHGAEHGKPGAAAGKGHAKKAAPKHAEAHGAAHAEHAAHETKVGAHKTAAKHKVAAKEADADHAKAKLEVGKALTGKKGKAPGAHAAHKAKLAETGKRAAEKKVAAADATKKAHDVEARHGGAAHGGVAKKGGAAAAAGVGEHKAKPGAKGHAKPAAHGKGLPGAEQPGKGAPAGAGADQGKAAAKHGKQEAHAKKVEAAVADHHAAKAKVAEAHEKKTAAELKADAAHDPAKKSALSRETETHATAAKAAQDHAHKKGEAVDAVQAAKEKDPTIHEISRAADLHGRDGDEVSLVGIYMPRPAESGGPQLGHASILVGNQEIRLGTDPRSTAEILQLSGERVLVTGKLDLKEQAGQAVDPHKREKPVLTGFHAPHRK